jgi:hypothetical protein
VRCLDPRFPAQSSPTSGLARLDVRCPSGPHKPKPPEEMHDLDTLVTKSLLLLTFVATLLALRGETWDKNKRGLSKLSTTGWFIAFLSFSAMCLTWYWQDKQEADERSARDRSLSDLLYTSYSIWNGASHPIIGVREDIVERSCGILDSQIVTRRKHIDLELAPSVESLAAECMSRDDQATLLFNAHEVIVDLCKAVGESDSTLFDVVNCVFYVQSWERGVVAYTADGQPAWITE